MVGEDAAPDHLDGILNGFRKQESEPLLWKRLATPSS